MSSLTLGGTNSPFVFYWRNDRVSAAVRCNRVLGGGPGPPGDFEFSQDCTEVVFQGLVAEAECADLVTHWVPANGCASAARFSAVRVSVANGFSALLWRIPAQFINQC